MATWDELKAHLLSEHAGEDKGLGLVAVTKVLQDEQHRVTFVSCAEDSQGRPWASIDALVTTIAAVDVLWAVRSAGEQVCGGLATLPVASQEYLVLRHAVPIDTLCGSTISDFMIPFDAVTRGASELDSEIAELNSS